MVNHISTNYKPATTIHLAISATTNCTNKLKVAESAVTCICIIARDYMCKLFEDEVQGLF